MTTVLAYTTGQDVNAAMGLAIPFALIGQWIHIAANTFYAGFLPAVDKAARRGDEKAIGRILFTSQSGSLFLCAISLDSDIEQGSYHESENSPQGAKGAPSQIAAYPLT